MRIDESDHRSNDCTSRMRLGFLRRLLVACLVAPPLAATDVFAEVTISSDATSNMSCESGVCAPTATDAVLNVGDLENLLASGNIEVTTTGSGVQADDIAVEAGLTWSNTSTLALDAYRSITIEDPVSVTGQGGFSLATNDGGKKGMLSFADGGDVTFENLSSQLTINGNSYVLAGSVSGLAVAIAANPSGYFALANNYDASGDGTYTRAPITTEFRGTFEGLGNAISNLTIVSRSRNLGLFGTIKRAVLSDIGVVDVSISGGEGNVGGLVGNDKAGTIEQSYSSGAVTARRYAYAGGLVGYLVGGGSISGSSSSANVAGGFVSGGLVGNADGGRPEIAFSYATGNVAGDGDADVGGLIGQNAASDGIVMQSFATGNVTVKKGAAGGLIGNSLGKIVQTYATGSVSGVWAGGLVGENQSILSQSYSNGAVSGSQYEGGLIGNDHSQSGDISHTYWDTTSSGVTNLSQGAGNIANDPGITGLSTAQLQAGLPKGFRHAVWREEANVNDGLPFLIANPPPS